MIEKRDIVKSIIFTVITCGIYGIFWMISINDDTKTVSKDETLPSGGMVILLTLVTCGIYSWYWLYKVGKLLYKAQLDRNDPAAKDNTVLYIVLAVFGLAIVDYILIQDSLNDMSAKQ